MNEQFCITNASHEQVKVGHHHHFSFYTNQFTDITITSYQMGCTDTEIRK